MTDLYETSLLVLKASEDKVTPGEFIASPATPDNKVGATDLYQIASALLAAGDTATANQAVDYLFDHLKSKDPLSIVLAWQLGRVDRWDGVKLAADEIVSKGTTDTPGTTADEIAGLVCAAGIARANHDEKSAAAYEAKADAWAGAKLATKDPGVLEFVRLGVKRAADPQIVAAVGTLAAPDSPRLEGERGEYELAAGRPATAQLVAMAGEANDGGMIPAQNKVSATPLAWSHAQFVRLAVVDGSGPPDRDARDRRDAVHERQGASALSSLADLAPVRGFPLPPGASQNPRLSEHAFHGPRRRPDRSHPRVRGLQAPELSDKEIEAQ